jgi:hypothetical protein
MDNTNQASDQSTPVPVNNSISDRVISSQPTQFRMLKKSDGSIVMQSGYSWSSATESGIEWMDVPTVTE